MRIRTQCRSCGLPFRAVLSPDSSTLACPGCDDERPVAREGWTDGQPGSIEICPLCGCRHLYRQRDVNRALGCCIVLVGAALAPWTYGASLLAATLVDWFLYRRLPEAAVCYRCDTVFRDAAPLPRQTGFDLLKHDVVKYGTGLDAGSH